MGGGHQRAVWEQQIWLVTRGRGVGGVGQGGGQGGVGGAPERRRSLFFLGSLENLTIGLIWLVTRGGGVGGVGQGGGQGGVDGGGGTREQCGSNRKTEQLVAW